MEIVKYKLKIFGITIFSLEKETGSKTEALNTEPKIENKIPEYVFNSSSIEEEEYKQEDKTIVTCSTCDGKDYAEYISTCSMCGKNVCGNCATGYEGQTLCEECWNDK